MSRSSIPAATVICVPWSFPVHPLLQHGNLVLWRRRCEDERGISYLDVGEIVPDVVHYH